MKKDFREYLTEVTKEAKSWLEPINEQTTIQVQMKKGDKIVFTKNYNSQDVQQFYRMQKKGEPIFFDEEVKSLKSEGTFYPYIIDEIVKTDSGIIIYLKERHYKAYFVKK